MARSRIAIPWNEEDFAVVGIPTRDGEEVMAFLERKAASGACRLEWGTGREVLHSDGRYYRDIGILRVHGGDEPQEIANLAMAYLPDWNLIDSQASEVIALHRDLH